MILTINPCGFEILSAQPPKPVTRWRLYEVCSLKPEALRGPAHRAGTCECRHPFRGGGKMFVKQVIQLSEGCVEEPREELNIDAADCDRAPLIRYIVFLWTGSISMLHPLTRKNGPRAEKLPLTAVDILVDILIFGGQSAGIPYSSKSSVSCFTTDSTKNAACAINKDVGGVGELRIPLASNFFNEKTGRRLNALSSDG
jgi:hypothetical protein